MARATTALIVDDEEHARTYVRLLLRELGVAKTWEACDGAQALALFNEHKPDLVLLDVNLRILNGLQVLQQLAQSNPGLPVVIISSESAMKTVNEALRLGATDYILKHTPKDEVLATLRQMIESLAEE